MYILRSQCDVGSFLDAFDAGLLDEEMRGLVDRPPRRRLTRRAARKVSRRIPTGTIVGLEHEFSTFAAGERVDFRRLIHTLPIDGVRADPSDPNAYRGRWGGVITCDGEEAEIAIPPVDVDPGFVGTVLEYADRGVASLSRAAPDLCLVGYSTHLSVSVADHDERRLARTYAQTFAPAMMLLMDGLQSPGLLVRPRPGRLELCGEHVHGNAARAAVAFAVGSVRALSGAHRCALGELRVKVTSEPAVERYGTYIDRKAFGADLYACGRHTTLITADGKPRSAQHQLELAWTLARDALSPDAEADDFTAADLLVSGRLPLPCEGESSDPISRRCSA